MVVLRGMEDLREPKAAHEIKRLYQREMLSVTAVTQQSRDTPVDGQRRCVRERVVQVPSERLELEKGNFDTEEEGGEEEEEEEVVVVVVVEEEEEEEEEEEVRGGRTL